MMVAMLVLLLYSTNIEFDGFDMLKKFLPQKNEFFIKFQNMADILVAATEQFYEMVNNLEKHQNYVDQIANYEQQADQITYSTLQLLHQTFITPFDRHEIHELADGLDDILDLVNRCTQRFPFYKLHALPEEIIGLADLSYKATVILSKAVYHLHSSKHYPEILQWCKEISDIESHAHLLVIAGEEKLFLDENDFKHFFKLKWIYGKTKLVVNRTKDVANAIKGIVFEYS